jgi:signal transduction histidine kinase
MTALVDQAALAIENSHLHESIAELDQAKVEFIDFVAHELKQPMTAMQGYTKMLMMGIGGELSDTQSQFAQVINANVNRMGKLVNDLLEISRLEAGRITLKLELLQPKEIVEDALAAIQVELEAREHSLEVRVPGDLPPFTGDLDRLVQILTYLLSNACMYTPNSGKICVSVNGPAPTAAPPGHLLFSISDTGIGMSAEELASLDKFFRADHDLVISQPGTGLGVSIARNLIELHGGELMVESEPDQGSTFSFTVPIAQSDGA